VTHLIVNSQAIWHDAWKSAGGLPHDLLRVLVVTFAQLPASAVFEPPLFGMNKSNFAVLTFKILSLISYLIRKTFKPE